MSSNPKDGRGDIAKAFTFFTQIGINITVCIGVGVFAGRWLDGFFGTSPWFLLLFSFLGAGAAFKSIIDLGKR
ncbi:MAG: AtpZ/AtpI family protein [Oscillospiraceae bacterium]|jgi:ATP synthase protein I|nr:AtpZ/AtpI family protein [Oscillospiraceae bacterium]